MKNVILLSVILLLLSVMDMPAEDLEFETLKYKVEPVIYTPVHNPASLAFLKTDSFYIYMGMNLSTPDDLDVFGGGNQLIDGSYIKEWQNPVKLGYMFPLGEKLGISVEYTGFGYDGFLMYPFFFDYLGSSYGDIMGSPRNNGGIISIGYSYNEEMSLGLSGGIWTTDASGEELSNFLSESGNYFSISAGYVLRVQAPDLILNFSTSYTNQLERYINYSQLKVFDGTLPLLLEASVLTHFLNRTMYFSLTGISDIYIDGRGGYVLKMIPVLEYRPFSLISIRVGGEYSHLNNEDKFALGYGFLGGLSVKIKKIQLNANFTIRKKPSRLLPGAALADRSLTVGITVNPSIIDR